jgi:hypothetical protein
MNPFPTIACLLIASAATALEVGDHIAALGDVAWISSPADISGKVALIDLWSPDSASTRAVMPRLTDLQRRHPEAVIVSLTATDPEAAQRFIAGMGSRIGYAVGVVPSLTPFDPGIGVPCAVVIDRSGRVVWWGDAMNAVEPLTHVLDGTFVAEPPHHAAPQPASMAPAAPTAPSDEQVMPMQMPVPQAGVQASSEPAPPPADSGSHTQWSFSFGLAAPFPYYGYHDGGYHDHGHSHDGDHSHHDDHGHHEQVPWIPAPPFFLPPLPLPGGNWLYPGSHHHH